MGYYQRYQSNGELGDDYELRTDERGRYQGRSSAREYQSAGMIGDRGDYRDRGYGDRSYGDRDRGGYGDRSYADRSSGYGYSHGAYGGYGPYGERPDYRQPNRERYGPRYAAPRYRNEARDDYDYNDRGFFARAGDEVASWFGDDEAERRRTLDARYDQQYGNSGDPEYHGWRQRQIDALDRDYHDYRREKQQHFNQQFEGWRSERDTQRQSLSRVEEHMEVQGSDGEHVGTVDKVRGDRIILTKNDADADGHHHSVPARWVQSVDDKVTLNKSADEARRSWRDEERGALFGDNQRSGSGFDPATGHNR